MIDRNKLHRIQGVLSARQGAEIPKFQNPGGPLPTKQWDPKNEEFKTFAQQAGARWNPHNYQYYYYLRTKNPDAPLEQLVSSFDENLIKEVDKLNSSQEPSTKIPGTTTNTNNVNAAVENAAQQTIKTEDAKQNIIADQQSQVDPQVQAIQANKPDLTKPISPNDSPKIPISQPAAIPEKLEVPASILEEQKSAGMQMIADKEKAEKKAQFIEKFGNGLGQVATQGLQIAGDYFGAQQAATDSNLTKGADALYDTAAETVKKLGPVGQIVGTAMGFAGMAGDIIQGMGGGTDQMTTTDKWMDSSFFSWNIGMLNGFAGKKTDAFAADQDILANVGSSYGGTTEDINNAAAKSGKKYGLFSSSARRKANRQMAEARAKQNIMGDISDEATDQRLNAQSMGEQAGLAYSLMTDGGYSQKYTYAAKHGGLLEWNPKIELTWEPQIELNWELPEFKEGGSIEIQEELEWIPEFKFGSHIDNTSKDYKVGTLDISIEETTQKNVIPEGALHKNKHHMEHAEGLTKKGIPVIDEDGEQQAEIEHSEIIFTLEVTKKLEEYYDIFYSEESSNKEKEQAALDAGKLLVYQILENTEDRTGLIESCKKGGSLKLKTSTDDLIEEVLEWMPTILVIEEEEIKEEKPKEDKKKSEKEQMKEAIKEVLIELLTK